VTETGAHHRNDDLNRLAAALPTVRVVAI